MKLRFSLFDKMIAFDKSSHFVKQVISPISGSHFVASTELNNSTVKISFEGSKRKHFIKEHVLQIPLNNKPLKVVGDKLFISFPGPEPQAPSSKPAKPPQCISIGGPEPKKTKHVLNIALDATKGNWHIEPDLAADVLNISFDGPE